jgi:hypothetical protein
MRYSVFLSLLLLAGCDTVYQPLGWDGGYEDKPLPNHIHWIKYQGNSTTPDNWVLESWHKRAAQLCINGYQTTQINVTTPSNKDNKILELPLQRQNPVVEGKIHCLMAQSAS